MTPTILALAILASPGTSPRLLFPDASGIDLKNSVESWKGKHWAIVKEKEIYKFQFCNVLVTTEKSSLPNDFPDYYWIKSSSRGGLVCFIDGFKISKQNISVSNYKISQLSTKVGDTNKISSMFKGTPFSLAWIENHSYNVDQSIMTPIELELGNTKQIIGQLPNWYTFKLLWAGDMDGDGRLDILVRIETDKGNGEYQLFLSTKSPNNYLLGLAIDLPFESMD